MDAIYILCYQINTLDNAMIWLRLRPKIEIVREIPAPEQEPKHGIFTCHCLGNYLKQQIRPLPPFTNMV